MLQSTRDLSQIPQPPYTKECRGLFSPISQGYTYPKLFNCSLDTYGIPARAALANVRRLSIDACSTDEIFELWKLRFVFTNLFEISDLGRDHAWDAVVVAVLISEPLGHSSDSLDPLDISV